MVLTTKNGALVSAWQIRIQHATERFRCNSSYLQGTHRPLAARAERLPTVSSSMSPTALSLLLLLNQSSSVE